MPTTIIKKLAVIGGGFAGLSAACHLAKAGHSVDLFEKNESLGGRARQFSAEGFTFDMGPSWYWMPDVFERFFNQFNKSPEDYYSLKLLEPSFSMVFDKQEVVDIPANYEELKAVFESLEKGSGKYLDSFMEDAAYKYEVGINQFVYKPSHSILEFADPKLLKGALKLNLFSSFRKHLRKYFSDPRIIALMEFPVLFLGAAPEDTPALYSLMNYAGLKLGTWYPDGGFGSVIKGMATLAEELGVKIHLNSPIEKIEVSSKKVQLIKTKDSAFKVDGLIGAADYNHIEQELLPLANRRYDSSYWKKKVFAPSCLLFYIGIGGKVARLGHHTLFFDESLDAHSIEIYKTKQWPEKPLFYVCAPSKTDASVAPEGDENLFLLVPIAPGLKDEEETRKKYFDIVMKRLETYCGEEIESRISYMRSYCIDDFVSDYNAYGGNAYGLANTLMQTAFLKPKMRPKNIENMYFAGQLTVPGPGVPPSLISGEVAALELINKLNLAE